MFFSLTDSGGRRVSGNRRLIRQKGAWDEKRSGSDRRDSPLERRTSKEVAGNRYERRAMPLFLETQKKI